MTNPTKRPSGRPRLPDSLLSADAIRMRKVYAERRRQKTKGKVAKTKFVYGKWAFTPSYARMNGALMRLFA